MCGCVLLCPVHFFLLLSKKLRLTRNHKPVNQGLTTMVFAGVEVNLVLFSKSVLRQTNAEAANTFSRWLGTMYLCSLLGAFLSDSYLGRFRTCVIFQVVFAVVSHRFIPLPLIIQSGYENYAP